MKTWNICSLDVWGNKKDGFEVNDVFKTGATLELSDNDSNTQIVQKLKHVGYLNKRLKISSFSIEQYEQDIYIKYLGEPVYQLRLQQD